MQGKEHTSSIVMAIFCFEMAEIMSLVVTATEAPPFFKRKYLRQVWYLFKNTTTKGIPGMKIGKVGRKVSKKKGRFMQERFML